MKSAKTKYKEKLDRMWSQIIRLKYKETCVMCGKSKEKNDVVIQAHHAIKRKAAGNQARYDLRNGIALCYSCHICHLHGESADLQWHKDYIKKLDKIIPIELQEQIIQDSSIVVQDNALYGIELNLKSELDKIKA